MWARRQAPHKQEAGEPPHYTPPLVATSSTWRRTVGADLVFALRPGVGTEGEHKVRPYAHLLGGLASWRSSLPRLQKPDATARIVA